MKKREGLPCNSPMSCCAAVLTIHDSLADLTIQDSLADLTIHDSLADPTIHDSLADLTHKDHLSWECKLGPSHCSGATTTTTTTTCMQGRPDLAKSSYVTLQKMASLVSVVALAVVGAQFAFPAKLAIQRTQWSML